MTEPTVDITVSLTELEHYLACRLSAPTNTAPQIGLYTKIRSAAKAAEFPRPFQVGDRVRSDNVGDGWVVGFSRGEDPWPVVEWDEGDDLALFSVYDPSDLTRFKDDE